VLGDYQTMAASMTPPTISTPSAQNEKVIDLSMGHDARFERR
jgi:hypothetical protein